MIGQRMMVGSKKDADWTLVFNTQATVEGEITIGIPFNLYGQTGVVLDVDWGDGTSSTLDASDYGAADASASIHEYSQPGIYTVGIKNNRWRSCYIFAAHSHEKNTSNLPSAINNAIAPLYWYQRTLTETSVLPPIKGTCFYDSNSSPTNLSYHDDSAAHIFERCTKLTTLPNKLFGNNRRIEYFTGTFEGCTSLAYIPADIFAGVHGSKFGECFQGCFSLSAIPQGLFTDCIGATDFSECFCYCHLITSIPGDLFKPCINATDFSSCFHYCTELASIPPALFAAQTEARNFDQCFSSTKISSIPSGLFDACTLATNFRRAFSDCASLTTVPDYLFRYCTAATSFIGLFGGYPSSGSVPNYNGISLRFMGANNSSLSSLPAHVFHGATSANDFESAFKGCVALESIPETLFQNNSMATSFRETFENCESLQTIPGNLFSHNTAITTLYRCLYMDGTDQLGNFTIHVPAENITNCSDFVTPKAGTTRTIYVPANSTTETAFNAVASTLGLTIIGE